MSNEIPNYAYIVILGVAIGYKKYEKDENGKEEKVWKILFPYDNDQHTIKFSYVNIDHLNFEHIGELNNPKSKIEILAPKAMSNVEESPQLKEYAFDLTSSITHEAIEIVPGAKYVEMTIPNARMGVFLYLDQFPTVWNEDAYLSDGVNPPKRISKHIAHSVLARIDLGDGSVYVSNAAFGKDPINIEGSSILLFNNDCIKCPLESDKSNNDKDNNDMRMFYDIIRDVEDKDKQFIIRGERTNSLKFEPIDEKFFLDSTPLELFKKMVIKSTPPSLADDKPCMFSRASGLDEF